MFSSDANCSQYLLDVKILPTKRRCSLCTDHDRMVIKECSTSSYKDGCCWQCPKGHKTSLKAGSILENSNITYREFILILASFADSLTVTRTAERVNVAETTVRRIFHSIREQMAEDIKTSPKIGGPSTIVEVDEAKFGKQKFNRGRPVEGKWMAGGIQRHSDLCFLAICPENKRDAATLGKLVQTYVRRGTTVITDKWKGYVNLTTLGYIHLDVNHSTNFVDPETGANTNSIEGTWTHAKRAARIRHGGVRSEDSFALDISQFIWMKQKGLLRSRDIVRDLFSKDLPDDFTTELESGCFRLIDFIIFYNLYLDE